ncbi:MAG TPA: hypothetical protein VL326_27430 [Kofleriaceae bacterium]|nr:hypothetical protein [Kofleriaceae bacterium]
MGRAALLSLLLAGGCDIVVGIKPVREPPGDAAPADVMSDAGPTPCNLISMLGDDFNDNDLDVLWPGHSGTVNESNGVVTLDASATTYAQLSANRYFDFRNGFVSALIDSPSTFDGSSEINMYLQAPKKNYMLRITRRMNGFTFFRQENGQDNVIGTKPYDPVTDRYWKIANNGGVAEFSFSPNGTNYTIAASVPGLPYIDFMTPTFTAYRSATPLVATIDDVNGGTASGIACPARSLADNFDDGTLDEKWTARSQVLGAGTLSEQGGYADLSFPMLSQVILESPSFVDLRDDQFVIEVPQNVSTSSINTFSMQVSNVSGGRIELSITGTEMRGWQYTPTQMPHGTGTFVPGTHRWFRFRSKDNFIYWETSADGVDWGATPFGSTNDFPGLDRVDILVAVAANGGTSGDVHVDNWNLPPP